MSLLTNHRQHIILMALAVVAAAVLGWGAGVAVALAVLGCTAMFVAMIWLFASQTQRHQNEQSERNADS